MLAVSVEDSFFTTGDDGIVFSSGNTNTQRVPFMPQPPPPCERAVVRNVSIEEAERMGIPTDAADGYLNVSVYERCSSVHGEPTRGTRLDGSHGRALSHADARALLRHPLARAHLARDVVQRHELCAVRCALRQALL